MQTNIFQDFLVLFLTFICRLVKKIMNSILLNAMIRGDNQLLLVGLVISISHF